MSHEPVVWHSLRPALHCRECSFLTRGAVQKLPHGQQRAPEQDKLLRIAALISPEAHVLLFILASVISWQCWVHLCTAIWQVLHQHLWMTFGSECMWLAGQA